MTSGRWTTCSRELAGSAGDLELDAEPVGEPVDEVEVADDLGRAQDLGIAPTGRAKRSEAPVGLTARRAGQRVCVFGESTIARVEQRRPPVGMNGVGEAVIVRGAAETRRVVLDSIVTPVGGARDDRQELALRSRERPSAEHQAAIERVMRLERRRRQRLHLEDVRDLTRWIRELPVELGEQTGRLWLRDGADRSHDRE